MTSILDELSGFFKFLGLVVLIVFTLAIIGRGLGLVLESIRKAGGKIAIIYQDRQINSL